MTTRSSMQEDPPRLIQRSPGDSPMDEAGQRLREALELAVPAVSSQCLRRALGEERQGSGQRRFTVRAVGFATLGLVVGTAVGAGTVTER